MHMPIRNLNNTLIFSVAFLLTFLIAPSLFAGDERVRLECEAQGAGDISMDARYEKRRVRKKFDVSFEALPGGRYFPGQVLTVRVATRNVGRMRLSSALNGDIVGDLNFDSAAGLVDDDLPFPNNFPNVKNRTPVRLLLNKNVMLGCRLN